MSKHNKFRLVVILITIVAFVGIRLYIRHLDAEIEKNIQDIHQMEDQLKPPEEQA